MLWVLEMLMKNDFCVAGNIAYKDKKNGGMIGVLSGVTDIISPCGYKDEVY